LNQRLLKIKIMKLTKKLWQSLLVTTVFLGVLACNNTGKQESEEENDEVYVVVEELPSFEGGMEAFYSFITNEVKYPLAARTNNTEGRVLLSFIIDRDGSVSEVEVVEGIGDGCDEEARRVLEAAPVFKPGKQRGKTVRVKMMIPIVFQLKEDAKNTDGSSQGMVIIEEAEIEEEEFTINASYTDGRWVGSILDSEGNALPGANIIEVNTNNGTVADLDGSFELAASESGEVIVSFVGYKTTRLDK
jgi:TonB family protein